MSTRSYIGIKNEDGSIRAIYHHFDSYIESGVGEVLFQFYRDEDKINKLLDLGDMAMIGEEPIGYWSDYGYDPSKCRTYRERGETNVDARIYKDEETFLNKCCEDFTYLYKDGEWYVREWKEELKQLKNYF